MKIALLRWKPVFSSKIEKLAFFLLISTNFSKKEDKICTFLLSKVLKSKNFQVLYHTIITKKVPKFCWKTLLGSLLCDTYKKKKKKKKKQMFRLRAKRVNFGPFWPKFIIFWVIAAIMDLKWLIFFFNIILITNAQLLSPKLDQ